MRTSPRKGKKKTLNSNKNNDETPKRKQAINKRKLETSSNSKSSTKKKASKEASKDKGSTKLDSIGTRQDREKKMLESSKVNENNQYFITQSIV